MSKNLISVEDACDYLQVEISFIKSLEDFGLINIIVDQTYLYLESEELSKLQRYLRLTNDLQINMEGLHAVELLLERIGHLESRIVTLENLLNYYRQINGVPHIPD
jgi:chaperone modulatory protein CbpM